VSARPSLSIIVATYAWPEALDAVLYGLAEQADFDFDVVVAEDAAEPKTAAVVASWRAAFGGRLLHVTQPDEGYRLARVKNLGATAAQGDYLVLIDGDSIPRAGFTAAIRRSALPGWFLGGKRLELSRDLSGRVLAERLPVQRWSFAHWLWTQRARALEALTPRDRRRPGRNGLPEFVPHTQRYGFLFGVSRADFERVNGFDMRYEGWGEEDIDLAVRLRRLGLRCGWAGPHSTLLHLWHETRKGDRPNLALLDETKASDRVEAISGLAQLRTEDV
jgi:GT2 family glycosyltransferase